MGLLIPEIDDYYFSSVEPDNIRFGGAYQEFGAKISLAAQETYTKRNNYKTGIYIKLSIK